MTINDRPATTVPEHLIDEADEFVKTVNRDIKNLAGMIGFDWQVKGGWLTIERRSGRGEVIRTMVLYRPNDAREL